MGCGSSHSVPVTPEYGDNRRKSLTRSSSNQNTDLSVQDDVFSRQGGEGGKEVGNETEAELPKSEQMNDQKKEERRMYDADHEEDDRPKSDRRKINGILTERRVLNEVSSPRSNSGRSKNLAFEVPAIDGSGNSLIKRHPPKKFQKLEEQQSDANITQEQLEEKQAIAEKRRQEILSKRVKSAKTASAKSVQARAKIAESKEVDQDGDEPIESAKIMSSEGGI